MSLEKDWKKLQLMDDINRVRKMLLKRAEQLIAKIGRSPAAWSGLWTAAAQICAKSLYELRLPQQNEQNMLTSLEGQVRRELDKIRGFTAEHEIETPDDDEYRIDE
jgi:hypothetical protein